MQIKGLSNVKEEVYGALDSFIAWELEFPLITVKKALKALEIEREWKRIIQVILLVYITDKCCPYPFSAILSVSN